MRFNKKASKEKQAADQGGSVETLEKDGDIVDDGQNHETAPGTRTMSANKGGESDDERNKSKTPALDEKKLQNYDLRKTKIADLLAEVSQEEALADASRPVREVMQVTYGVKYEENLNEGGKVNCTMGG